MGDKKTNYAGKSKNEMIAKFEHAKQIGIESIARNDLLREELARQQTKAKFWFRLGLVSLATAAVEAIAWGLK